MKIKNFQLFNEGLVKSIDRISFEQFEDMLKEAEKKIANKIAKGIELTFAGQNIEYWLDYAEDEETVSSTEREELYYHIRHIIEEYRTGGGDDPDGKVADMFMLWRNMLALAVYSIEKTGKIDVGVLSAYCMQNMDDYEPWEHSPHLVKVNRKTGIFDDED
jgi:hypothetical protein